MADTRTRPGVDRTPLIAYLKVQRASDREMVGVLTRSYERINSELKVLAARPGIGAAVRADQLRLTQAAIQRELSTMWANLGRTILAGQAEAAAAAIESMYQPKLLRAVMPAADVDYLLRSAKATARSGVSTVMARRGISQIPLAESVYKNRQLSSGKVDAIVDEALARGASARELATSVRRYVRPDVRGGVRYAAMRLGRTELNNAFHAQQIQSGIDTPWTTALKWEISGSHPRPDECDDYAEGTFFRGGGPGEWLPADVPAHPHPNCLCFTTPVTVGREQFVNDFLSGKYDDFVDRIIGTGSVVIR